MKIINDLLILSEKADNLYDVLRYEEMDGNKNSKKYFKTLKKIKKINAFENSIYFNLKEGLLLELKDLVEIRYKYSSIGQRIYNFLDFVNANNKNNLTENAVDNNIILNELMFIEELIDNPSFSHIKDKLINEKYEIIFRNPRIGMVLNNIDFNTYKIGTKDYPTTYYTDIINVDDSICELMYLSKLKNTVDILLEIKDEEYNNKMFLCTMYQIEIKSILTLINNKAKAWNIIYDCLKYSKNPKSISLLISVLEEFKNSKVLTKN